MTPKEKAEELFDRIINTEHCGIKHFPNKNYCDCTEMNRFQSIQCALIAVDEIIEFEKRIISQLDKITKDARGSFICESEYYLEVKLELEKL